MKSSTAFRTFLSLALAVVPLLASAATDESALKPDRPDRYTVQRGDTLWGIASRFLKEPWRWPELWRLNRDQIRNPHRIYPGNVIVLQRAPDGYRLAVAEPTTEGQRETVRLSPEVRVSELGEKPIPSIPAEDIEPWLTRSLIVDADFFAKAAKIVSTRDQRLLLVERDSVYAFGLDRAQGDHWLLFRRGPELRALRSSDTLGYTATYLGTARVDRHGDISRLVINTADREILVGDFLVPAPPPQLIAYVPRAPDRDVHGHIVSLPEGVGGAGQAALVTIDLGGDAGMEVGHVLAVYRPGGRIRDPREYNDPNIFQRFTEQTLLEVKPERWVNLPDDRMGLVFVFKVFNRVAFAYVLEADLPLEVGDVVRTPPRR